MYEIKNRKSLMILDVIITFALVVLDGYLVYYHRNQILIYAGMFIMLCGIVIFVFLMKSKDKRLLFVICFCCFLLIIIGYLVLVLSRIFPNNKDPMINFYATMVGALVSSGVGIFGGIYGARIGGEQSRLASVELLREYLRQEAELKENEKKEKADYIQNIFMTFLKQELEINYEILDISGKKNLPIGTIFNLRFDEYEKVKYILLENPTRIVREVNKLYSLFHNIVFLNENFNVEERLKKMDEIIEQKNKLDDLFNDVRLAKFSFK